MDEKSRIQAATILQGIVKGYMNQELLLLRLLQKHRKRFVSALSFFLLYYKWFLYAVFDLLINSPFLIIVNGQV